MMDDAIVFTEVGIKSAVLGQKLDFLTHKPRNDLRARVYIRKSPLPDIFRS
jgi:hypothetical protein